MTIDLQFESSPRQIFQYQASIVRIALVGFVVQIRMTVHSWDWGEVVAVRCAAGDNDVQSSGNGGCGTLGGKVISYAESTRTARVEVPVGLGHCLGLWRLTYWVWSCVV
jgi:hypothetical protein